MTLMGPRHFCFCGLLPEFKKITFYDCIGIKMTVLTLYVKHFL